MDSLFRYVYKGLFGTTPTRDDKTPFLTQLHDAGVHLIDTCLEPIADGAKVRITSQDIESLVARCKALKPDAIVLIKSNVYDLLYERLSDTGFNVVNVRMPFPGSGQQRNFEVAFAEALKQVNMSR